MTRSKIRQAAEVHYVDRGYNNSFFFQLPSCLAFVFFHQDCMMSIASASTKESYKKIA